MNLDTYRPAPAAARLGKPMPELRHNPDPKPMDLPGPRLGGMDGDRYIPFPEPRPRGPRIPDADAEHMMALNERLECLYEKRDALDDRLAQARIRTHGTTSPMARAAARLEVSVLEARRAGLQASVTVLENERQALMDRWSFAHNDGPGRR